MSDQYDFHAQLVVVDFHDQKVPIVHHEGRPYVPLKPICDNLGIDWSSQHKRVKRDPVLNEGMVNLTMPSKGGAQEMACLPLEYLNGWLFGISDNAVSEGVKDRLLMYKRECYSALSSYFSRGFAIDEKRIETDEDAREALISRLRKLRTEDKALYKRILDAIKETSSDYEFVKANFPKRLAGFFAAIQDKFHYAVSGHTATELVVKNADGTKPYAGMLAYSGDPHAIKTADVATGKNYLNEKEFRKLENIYEQLWLLIESRILNGEKMTIAKWESELQNLLLFNGYTVMTAYSSVSRRDADAAAAKELRTYKDRLRFALPPADED
ncbi:RhuM family protein [Azospirillum sp. B21]|uniref:RhuM family protein n=1 Tax=Azospirillum sp. B21 TaxID=2607496 RepID=UPI00165EDFCD|nr:RhuM family protein [Azospirillum sp. B21]